ncbi:MAG: AIM24 family protein, partial [Eubacterium sp.]|nr:AIM24 family protein [Eubacterium sp.]
MIIDTGNLAAMTESCTMDIQTVKGLKNIAFGGEGLFNTVVTGPGHIWLQSMPASGLAAAIQPYIVTSGN